jgi:hypothetical protein
LLNGSQTWSNTVFNFGPANATNVISCAGQTVTLPRGNYSALRMLAAAVNGSQSSQLFIVHYTDGTQGVFSQGLSDWAAPQPYAGETEAIIMGHRLNSSGAKDTRPFYLYGYSFKLNSGKTVQSVTLPNNANDIVAAISLVPNWEPAFVAHPFAEPAVTAGQNYSGTIATNAIDLNNDPLSFTKLSGPAWLAVSSNGSLSGKPLSADAGGNTFQVSVADPGGLTNTASFNINVLPAPAIACTITNSGAGIVLNWNGGIGPFQVQMATNLVNPIWVDVGAATSAGSFNVAPTNQAAFYRIVGQ